VTPELTGELRARVGEHAPRGTASVDRQAEEADLDHQSDEL